MTHHRNVPEAIQQEIPDIEGRDVLRQAQEHDKNSAVQYLGEAAIKIVTKQELFRVDI